MSQFALPSSKRFADVGHNSVDPSQGNLTGASGGFGNGGFLPCDAVMRGLRAITLTASVEHADFDLFVLGPGGTGRHSSVQKLLEIEAADRSGPSDWVDVSDVASPDRPKAINLPSWMARRRWR